MSTIDIQSLVRELDDKFQKHANTENGLAMSKYMKDHFLFFGIKAPLRNELKKEWLKTIPTTISHADQWKLVHELWKKEEREFQYVAVEYVNSWKPIVIEEHDVEHLEYLITHRSWWDSVDLLASTFLGKYYRKFPDKGNIIIEKWRMSNNIWLQRSCLLFQLKYADKTNVDILKDLILQFQPIKEFFIQKEIGWALRQYSKTDPNVVRTFVEEIQLKGLAAKEASKYL